MHRFSESVAAIATALTKFPDQTLQSREVDGGKVYNNRSDSPQRFCYASLSSGLDIVRKILGGQQIAIAQTTDIDRAMAAALGLDQQALSGWHRENLDSH
jgi:hypothetical protein